MAIMHAEAPAELSIAEALSVARASSYFMADAINAHLPMYLAPMLEAAPFTEVCDSRALERACILLRFS